MQLSTFALILGVLWYVQGFPLVFSDKQVTSWRKKMLKNETVLRYTAIVWAAISVLALRTQPYFTRDIYGILVVLAWVILVKALFTAWWPDQYSQMRISFENHWFKTHQSHMTLGVLMIAVGALFMYLGLLLM